MTGWAAADEENVWFACRGGKFFWNYAIEKQRYLVKLYSLETCWEAYKRSERGSAALAVAIDARARAAGVTEDLVAAVDRTMGDDPYDEEGEQRVRDLVAYVLALEGEARAAYIAHVRKQLAEAEAPAPAPRKRRYEAIGAGPDGMRARLKLLLPSAR